MLFEFTSLPDYTPLFCWDLNFTFHLYSLNTQLNMLSLSLNPWIQFANVWINQVLRSLQQHPVNLISLQYNVIRFHCVLLSVWSYIRRESWKINNTEPWVSAEGVLKPSEEAGPFTNNYYNVITVANNYPEATMQQLISQESSEKSILFSTFSLHCY